MGHGGVLRVRGALLDVAVFGAALGCAAEDTRKDTSTPHLFRDGEPASSHLHIRIRTRTSICLPPTGKAQAKHMAQLMPRVVRGTHHVSSATARVQ